MLVCLCCWDVPQHASTSVVACWHAGMLACWLMASQRGRGGKNAGMSVLLGCTPTCQHLGRDMLACWHAGMLVDGQPAREGGQECWSVCAARVHPSMPATPVVGMLACWLMASQRGTRTKNVGMFVLLGCTLALQTYQHQGRWHAVMLACWSVVSR